MKTCPVCREKPVRHAGHFCGSQCERTATRVASRAHQIVWRSIRAGKLKAIDNTVVCVDCGRAAKEYDHRDYTKPLDVVPVCGSCNAKRGTADVYAA